MSDFMRKFKSVFIVEDPNAVAPTPKEEKKEEVVANKKQEVKPNTTNTNTSTTKGVVNDKFTEILFAAMNAANIEGFDYIEFKQAVQSLANVPMDTATRYKSALAMATSMGADRQKLMDSVQHYLAVLKKEEEKFAAAVKHQRQQQVGEKEELIAHAQKGIDEKNAKIKAIQAEITQLQSQSEAMKQEIGQAVAKIEQTQADFQASYKTLTNQIEIDLANMKAYL